MNFDFTADIILQNQQVLLRPLTASDAQELLAIATANNDLVLYSPYKIHTAEYLAGFVQASLEERANQVRYPFAIFDKKTGTYAGSTSVANISNKDKRLEIGWTWIGKQFQQTGLNRACKFLLLTYAFETLNFERVEFKTDARNEASRKAIEKIGGQYEGGLRSHTVMNDGYRRTTVYYSILKEEWPRLKETVFLPYTTAGINGNSSKDCEK
jgi:N-acetyltransferase